MRFGAFPERVGSRTLSFESVDYFGTSEHFKKKKQKEESSMVRRTGRVL